MSETAPGISAIMAARNAADTIVAAITSLQRQTHQCWELVVVDDASSDGTGQVVRSLNDPRVRLLTLDGHRGRGHARNVAVAAARFDLLAIADADDISMPCRLASAVGLISQRDDIAAVGGQILGLDSRGLRRLDPWPTDPALISTGLLSGHMKLANPTLLMRREAFLDAGGYSESLAWAEDVDLLSRMALRWTFAASTELWCVYRRPARDSWRYLHNTEMGRLRGAGCSGPRVPPTPAARAAASAARLWLRQRVRRPQYLKREDSTAVLAVCLGQAAP